MKKDHPQCSKCASSYCCPMAVIPEMCGAFENKSAQQIHQPVAADKSTHVHPELVLVG